MYPSATLASSPILARADAGARRARARCASSASAPAPQAPPLVVKRSLRAGEVIEAAGSVLIHGDIERDASVRARGDVFVWGSLLGEVEIDGDDAAEVHAIDFRPEVVRIGDAVMDSPEHLREGTEDRRRKTGAAEVARVDAETKGIVVSAHDDGLRPASVPKGARRASYATGAYIGAVGAALLLAPTAVFSILFNAFDISSVWIRVFGVLCLTFSAYYVGTPFFESRGAPSGFYRSTVFGRTFVFVSLCAVALLERHAQRGLIILAVINAFSAFTMHLALRRAE